MANIAAAAGADTDLRQVVARIERLPYCSWHTKMRLIISTAWFFDAFDSLVIAYVLPSLIGMWKLTPQQIGSLIAVGFAGQLVGSIGAGWIAERWGRLQTMVVTLLIFTLGSLVCAFAWSYDSMWWIRFVQGIGLGGEVPLMAAYVNEFAKAHRRGQFSLGMQCLFAIGLTIVALVGVWAVPHLGWQSMFIIGAVPAVIAIPLRTTLPESPRWLASRGRFDEADRALKRIEEVAVRENMTLPPLPRDLPSVSEAKPRILDLFKGIYLKRTLTVWGIWICTYIITYGLTAWAPSLFRTVYKLDVQTSLLYGFVLAGIGLMGALSAIILIDRLGRRRMFILGLGVGALPLLAFGFGGQHSAEEVLTLISLSFIFVSMLALSLATYTAENYPTQLRALGGGVAGAWQRGASMVGPMLVGWILPHWGLDAVFVVFGVFAALGAILAYAAAIETRGQVLELLSPA
ncbi:MAG TPA: MFS transporter [Stellaceae bacterium]|nr:MFS transporter [Stellaceae bacterium]